MELVRAYVALGFKNVKSIPSKDVSRIVDRYLSGDDMQTIAKEEAARMKNDFRSRSRTTGVQPVSIHHTASSPNENVPTGPPTGDEDHPTQNYRRPTPRDVNCPPGYTRLGPYIVPEERPPTLEELRIKRNKTQEQIGTWRMFYMMTAIIVLLSNLLVAFTEQHLPIGFFPLPFFFGSWIMWQRRKSQHSKLQREIEHREIDELLNR